MRVFLPFLIGRRLCSQNTGPPTKGVLKIGTVTVDVKETERPELVPTGFASPNAPQEMLQHLKWLLQKEKLGQDVFLIGAPGYIRSHVVLQYLEMCNREFEWLSVNRDTTEADIKQRREIHGGSAFYSDLCAVRAALNGRVLVVDGVERAERNVLPILNNLLENREMQLDDGRFLMRHEAYDKLREKYSVDELKAMGVERVSERFHVVALGLPVPPFPGYSLDPPLRSRFQCANISKLGYQTMLAIFKAQAHSVDSDKANSLVSLAYAINSQEDLPLPHFPVDNLSQAAKIWNANPALDSEEVFRMLYPMNTILKDEQLKLVETFLDKFGVKSNRSGYSGEVSSVKAAEGITDVTITYNDQDVGFKTPCGDSTVQRTAKLVGTGHQKQLLAQMVSAHSNGDFGILGPKGCGKTAIVEEFAKTFGYATETMVMYQDLNTRELLQRRRMLPNGDTIWEDSALVETAKKGGLCVLDGVDRVHWSTLEVLSPLVHNRHLYLPDGTRLVGNFEFEATKGRMGLSSEEMNNKGIWSIPPSFRLILTGDSERGDHAWLNDPVLALMPFISHHSLSIKDQLKVITDLAPGTDEPKIRKLVELVHRMSESADAGLRGVALSLSLRKLIHIGRREVLHSGELRSNVEKAALARFLPSITKTAFANMLDEATITDDAKKELNWQDDIDALYKTIQPGEETMVPNVVFYDNVEHMSVMRDMARDLRLGSNLLLIGNQGVGKNKITDRFLHLINRPRHYMQLHRDTTVESLTVQTTVEGGLLKHEDSALVKAVKSGHILVVDEADKAPLQVIAILKSLLDSGTLTLGDGRRIQPAHFPQTERSIPLHPEFRMIMLANRPGFPFLGNDLFGVLGDLLSVHTVDNPSRNSELQMLKQYGPKVPDTHLHKLVSAFTELRDMADEGLLNYPYSTRELVNIVTHANEFPNDPLPQVVKNVFDFDNYDTEKMKTIEAVFQKHGIPLGVTQAQDNVFLATRHDIPPMSKIGSWGAKDNVIPLKLEQSIGEWETKRCIPIDEDQVKLEKQHMRNNQFTEQECAWQLDLKKVSDLSMVSDALSVDGSLAITTVKPVGFYYVRDLETDNFAKRMDLSNIILRTAKRGAFEPNIKLALYQSGKYLLHEETTNQLWLVDVNKWTVQQISPSQSLSESVGKIFTRHCDHRMVTGGGAILIHERNGHKLVVSLPESGDVIQADLPKPVEQITYAAKNKWLISWTEPAEPPMILNLNEKQQLLLREIDSSLPNDVRIHAIKEVSSNDANKNELVLAADGFYCLKSDGFPATWSESDVTASARVLPENPEDIVDDRLPYYVVEALPSVDKTRNLIVMDGGVIVQARGKWETPTYAIPKGASRAMIGGFLEAVDIKSGMVQYLAVPEPRFHSYHAKWLHRISKVPFHIVPYKEDKMLTVDSSGGVRSFEVSTSSLGKSYGEWRRMLEGEDTGPLRMEFNRSMDDFDLSKLEEPKVGKFDPQNTPHMGGNQWMGGTGGYGTAGMGGVGGPFRVDAGHDVHQMPDMAKQQVPEHILRKAREIAKAEYAKKLKEIEMSEYDDDSYQKLWKRVSKQSTHLKTIIEQLEAKKKERQWSRHQTSGDLDDGKLIEGMTGEKNIYRRRMDKPPEPGTPQVKPKRLRLCFDVSGSMYRFNGYDKRLQRSLEAALMVMAGLENKEDKIKYDLTGHSGDGPCTIFIKDKYPANNKERLELLKQMIAHTQFCMSGDYTLEALDFSIKQLAKEEDADERIVVLVSDANMQRYGIRPSDITKLLDKEKSVNCFVIFIGSLGDEADRLQSSLPAGRAYVCKDSADLPQIMQSIFASTLV